MAGPINLSVSEPHLIPSITPDLKNYSNGTTMAMPGRLDERRNSDVGLNTIPRMQKKIKHGHRRVDPEGNISFKKVRSRLDEDLSELLMVSLT